ncbi:MAG TPA: FtsW/RodA/SpoVE family cell cycle protein, partial [Trebonia sp.]
NADFILVTVGEELGMVGLFALMMVYTLFVMRGFKTALLIRDNYGKLLSAGLAVTFALQVFITAGGVMRVIPLTGLPMPFLAAGGSALVANWVVVALLIRLSDSARRPLPPAIPLTDDELRQMRLAAAQKMPSNASPGRHAQPAAPQNPAGSPRPHPLAQPGLGQSSLEQSGLGGPDRPTPPGATDPTEPMPVRAAGAAGAAGAVAGPGPAGSGDVTQAVPSQPRGYGEHTMLRAAEPTQAMQTTSGPRTEPEEGPTESYTPAFEDEEDDDVRTRPTPAPGATPGDAPGRPGPSERRFGP